MDRLDCKLKDLCCICSHYKPDNTTSCEYNESYLSSLDTNNHSSLYEKADLEELKKRVNYPPEYWTEEELNKIYSLINNYTLLNEEEVDEDDEIDFHIVHTKTDVIIITKTQYDKMISEGLKLETELEELKKRYKKLEAKYLQEFNKNINT